MFFYSESDGGQVSQGSAQATDPYFYDVSLLMQMDSDFSDSSTFSHTVTANGNATIDTNDSKYGAGSAYFDGSDYLTIPTSADLQFGTGDFTIEGWINLDQYSSTRPAIYSNYNSFGSNALSIFAGHSSANTTKYQVAAGGAFPAIQSSVSIQYNTWTHIALVRESGVIKLFIDGNLEGSYSYSGTIDGIGSNTYIGISGDTIAKGGITGNVDDFRITKGIARYTTNFTPPTEAHPTTGPGIVTDSLTLNLDIGDDTSYAGTGTTVNNIAGSDTATLTGNILFSSDNEGYLDFDGADDTMGVANGSSVDITDAITLEAWVNPDVVIGWISLIYKDNSQVSQGYHFGFDPSGRLQGGVRNNGIWRTTQPGAVAQMYVGQWQHIVMSMDSTTNVQKFYINGALVYTNSNFIYEVLSNTNPLSISGQPVTGVEKYNGKLAKAALYSRALTDTEVEQNFNALKNRFGL